MAKDNKTEPAPSTQEAAAAASEPLLSFRVLTGIHYDDEGEHTPQENSIVKSTRDLAAAEPQRYARLV